jgi:hypothetical protein
MCDRPKINGQAGGSKNGLASYGRSTTVSLLRVVYSLMSLTLQPFRGDCCSGCRRRMLYLSRLFVISRGERLCSRWPLLLLTPCVLGGLFPQRLPGFAS